MLYPDLEKNTIHTFSTENQIQGCWDRQPDGFLSSLFIYIWSSLSLNSVVCTSRGLWKVCAARLRQGVGLLNLLFSDRFCWEEMEAVSASFISGSCEMLFSRVTIEEPCSSRPSVCSPTCKPHQQSLLADYYWFTLQHTEQTPPVLTWSPLGAIDSSAAVCARIPRQRSTSSWDTNTTGLFSNVWSWGDIKRSITPISTICCTPSKKVMFGIR